MSALAFEAVTLVQNQIQTRRVEVSITSDEIMGFVDPVRIREVFQNLIENAVKFMGDQENPVVEIGARYDGEFTECHVRDNGIGINPSYHDVIFGLFERLDPNVNGTGVGLAIVKRIVESQGGRIWLESEGENMGTTFYFTVPAPK